VDERVGALVAREDVALVRRLALARRLPALLVGGAVRDALLGHAPHDFDFAVQGDAVALGRAVANALDAAFYIMDAERGTARVIKQGTDDGDQGSEQSAEQSAVIYDFARCRGDDWRADQHDRDFSINAIGVDLIDLEWVDTTAGRADLAAGVIRAVAPTSIHNDPVRALRGVRLAHQFGMMIAPATLALMRDAGDALLQPSAERLRDALFEIFELPHATAALQQLDALGLLARLFPEIEPMRAQAQSAPHRFTVLEHTWWVMRTLDREILDFGLPIADLSLKDSSLQWDLRKSKIENRKSLIATLQSSITSFSRAALLRYAALLHDCAKPRTVSVDAEGRIHFYGHEALGAAMSMTRSRALRLSGDEAHFVKGVIANHMRPNQMARMPAPPTPRALVRFFRDAGETAPLLALFALADCAGKRGDLTTEEDCAPSRHIAALLLERYYGQFEPQVAPQPLITGRDLLEMGMAPGRRVGEVLDAVREAQMAGELHTRDEALAAATQMLG
jgi:poly(A) polymerase/tRNA nucleotidyltransferase (CCA-adding enzyme)